MTSGKRETRATCEQDDGLRSEVCGFRNFDSSMLAFLSRFSRQSRLSRLSHAGKEALQ